MRIAYLADHPEAVPVLKEWFETEWADYYGPTGPGDAEQDLIAYSSREKLPVGLVAFCEGRLCGIAALKPDSIGTHTHLRPWAAAGLVTPRFRRRGIGASLVSALEDAARDLGYSTIYCGTSTAIGLLKRNGWELMERVRYNGENVSIYQKALSQETPSK
ncbi:MAG: GNAT family N-acetyltransferase [Candidatus Acidiferrales bacterium]